MVEYSKINCGSQPIAFRFYATTMVNNVRVPPPLQTNIISAHCDELNPTMDS